MLLCPYLRQPPPKNSTITTGPVGHAHSNTHIHTLTHTHTKHEDKQHPKNYAYGNPSAPWQKGFLGTTTGGAQ
jgi:hypothetical protein